MFCGYHIHRYVKNQAKKCCTTSVWVVFGSDPSSVKKPVKNLEDADFLGMHDEKLPEALWVIV